MREVWSFKQYCDNFYVYFHKQRIFVHFFLGSFMKMQGDSNFNVTSEITDYLFREIISNCNSLHLRLSNLYVLSIALFM